MTRAKPSHVERELGDLTAIVCGGSATGLQMVRDLASRGCRVAVADSTFANPALRSRYCSRKIVASSSDGSLIDAIAAFCNEQSRRPVLLPCSDEMVDLVAHNRSKLEEVAVLWESLNQNELRPFVDKQAFSEFCQANEIAMPRVISHSDLRSSSSGDIQYPLLLKPRQGHLWRRRLRGKKVVVLNEATALSHFESKFGDCLSEFLIQELIPGPEDNIWVSAVFTDGGGQVRSQFVGRKLRQYPRGFGSASQAESRWNEEVASLSRKIVASAGYRGLASTEFKFDPRDNQYKVIEVNPRPSLWWGLVEASSVPLISTAVVSLSGGDIQGSHFAAEGTQKQADHIKWSFFEKDVPSGLSAVRSGDLKVRDFLASIRGIDVHAVMSLRDIKPSLFALRYYLIESIRRCFSRSDRSSSP